VLEHRTPDKTYRLGTVTVAVEPAEPSLTEAFEILRRDPELTAERERLAPWLTAEPDKTLAFVAEMDFDAVEGPAVYLCPMHPEVVAEEPGHCPECGMKLLPQATTYTCPMHLDVVSQEPGRCPSCGMKLLPAQLVAQAGGHEHHGHEHADMDPSNHGEMDHGHGGEHADHEHHDHGAMDHGHGHDHGAMDHGHGHDHAAAGGIEWEDDMVDVNRITTPANMRWKLIDRSTENANHAIQWQFTVGDRVKIRLVNEMDSDHPMHHPFHLHGAGRFLVLARDGAPEPNLVWKDTVLVRTGQTVDILFDVTNPGLWMAHCHIAEHMQSGMMFSFTVARNQGAGR
jgi:hypothetical protein